MANGSNGRGNGQVSVSAPSAGSMRATLQSAMRDHQGGKHEAAEQGYQEVLEILPDDADALQLYGLLAKQMGNLDLAESLMRRSLASQPRQPHVENNLGNVLRSMTRAEEAVECYRRAVKLQPDYDQAWFNLGVTLTELDDFEEAETALNQAVALSPESGRVYNALGLLHVKQERLGDAEEAYRKAIELRPDYADARHNLGVVFKLSGRAEEAITCYRQALAAKPDTPEIHYNLGNALAMIDRIDEAEECFTKAIDLRPGFADAHKDLNFLLWVHGRHEKYLKSYASAIARIPESMELRLQHAESLLLHQAYGEAEEVLKSAFRYTEATAQAHDLMARVLTSQGRAQEAIDHHDKSMALAPDGASYLSHFGQTLLSLDEVDSALVKFDQASALKPLDQEIIAYRAICWRLLGDPREAVLNDYERLVRVYELPLPEGYSDAATFNRDLNAALDQFHRAKHHPPHQTLRNGTQNMEGLFDEKVDLVQKFRACLHGPITDYIQSMDDDPDHPLFSRRRDGYRFTGTYTVRLRSHGYHTNHVHPEGWISSAYYVDVPSVVAEGKGRQGWINFGQPGFKTNPPLEAKKWVQPKAGFLGLFPSYMWHGTIPFDSEQTRTTIVFDAVPA